MQCNCETPAIIINKHLPYFVLSRIKHLQSDFVDISKLRSILFRKRTCNDVEKLYNFVMDFMCKQTISIRRSTFDYVPDNSQSPILDDKGDVKVIPTTKIRVRSPFIDEIENGSYFTIIDTDTGECEYIFQLCECGHCSVCSESKRSTWSLRCELECQSHPYLPYFITLTYADAYLPKDLELSKRDLNNFVHRFRKQLLYKLGYDTPFRLLKCGEYGSLHGRPHYHLLLWFDKPFLPHNKHISHEAHDYLETSKLVDIVKTAWSVRGEFDKVTHTFVRKQIGFVMVEKCENDKAGAYLGKYLSKFNIDNNRFASHHRVKPFVIGTRKGGCIAKPFLLDLRQQFLKIAPNQDFKYFDRHSEINILRILPFNKWVLNVLCPTAARQIEKPYRDTYRQFYLNYCKLQQYAKEEPELNTFLNDIHVFPILNYDTCFAFQQPSTLEPHELAELISKTISEVFDLNSYGLDLDYINKIVLHREKFLCYHLATHKPKSIKEKVETISRHLHLENARHVLINDMQ